VQQPYAAGIINNACTIPFDVVATNHQISGLDRKNKDTAGRCTNKLNPVDPSRLKPPGSVSTLEPIKRPPGFKVCFQIHP
jgi:hypothetical protein